MIEAWFDNNSKVGMAMDFENDSGLDHYPSIAGAYFAAGLGVVENLSHVKHKAAALVLRQIHSEYLMPVAYGRLEKV
jgi:hypothetical protein